MGNPVNVGIAVQADWENREFISNISLNVRRLFDFLLRFGQLDRSAPPFYIHFPLLASIGSAAAASFHTMPSLAYPTLNGRNGTGLPCLPVLIAIRHHV